MKKIIFSLIFLYLLAGCNYYEYVSPPAETEPPLEDAVPAAGTLTDEYSLYYTLDDCALSLYEQAEGTYLGAYILSSKRISYDIGEYEKKTGKEHLIYTYHMKLGDELPVDWVLECMSRMKTPLIVIEPPDSSNPFDYELLKKTVDSFSIDTPMFIEFYPAPAEASLPVNEYVEFFAKAREAFNGDSVDRAFVFSVSGENTVDDLLYYPGDAYTDWVGIHLYLPVTDAENIYGDDIFSSIDMVYYTFQTSKPIMLSQFAVSHYTSRNHVYYTAQAAETVSSVYSKIAEEYPRIKAVIYMDFNNVELLTDGVRDNFSITDSETVLNAYSQAIQNESFITNFAYSYSPRVSAQIIKSPFAAKKNGDIFYMPDIIYNFPTECLPGEIITDYYVNHDKRQILINLKKQVHRH